MDGVYCTENLQAKTERGGERESATRLGPAEFSQIFALQLHHHVVESVITATANEATHVLLPLQLLQDSDFHLQYLLGLSS